MDEKHVSQTGLWRLSSKWVFLVYGLLLGALIILGIRFLTYKPMATHYHANFAVHIDGQKASFKDPKYYEEVKLCSLNGATPAARVHMHDKEPGLVHVHDEAVTWGSLFSNLGWGIGPDFLYDSSALHVADDTNKLHILLNGQDLTGLTDISNQVIGDKDRLLVAYGPEDQAALSKEYASVPTNAAQADTKPDPASCKGQETVTVGDRLKHLF